MMPVSLYQEWLESTLDGRLCEHGTPLQIASPFSKVEFQTRWFAGDFGETFTTTTGTKATILRFGSWNKEAGPVFTGASLAFDEGAPVQGGVEVHPDPHDWMRVGAENTEYDSTLLHIFSGGGIGGRSISAPATRTFSGSEVPQLCLDASPLEFRTETLPFPEGLAPLEEMAEEDIRLLLEASAEHRLREKAEKMGIRARRFGPEETLYQYLADTLGYRYNRLPFQLLTQRFPLSLVRRESAAEAELFLFAGSGFLSASDLSGLELDTRSYLRELWQKWWPYRTEFDRLTLCNEEGIWTHRGVRPVNHPQRRLAALAEIVRNWSILYSFAQVCDFAALQSFFSNLSHPYWDFHYTLTSKPSSRPMALVGETRAAEMLANLFLPAVYEQHPKSRKAYRKLPAFGTNERVEAAATFFFGKKTSAFMKVFGKQMIYHQGLLQLGENFKGADAERLADRLPKLISELKRGFLK